MGISSDYGIAVVPCFRKKQGINEAYPFDCPAQLRFDLRGIDPIVDSDTRYFAVLFYAQQRLLEAETAAQTPLVQF